MKNTFQLLIIFLFYMVISLPLQAQYTIGTPSSATGTINNDDFPQVSSIVRASANPTNANSVDFTITFNTAVFGVGTSDFTLTTTGDVAGFVSSVSGSGTTYTATVSDITGTGTLRLDLDDDDSIVANGQPIGGTGAQDFTTGEQYTVENTAPSTTSFTRKTPSSENTNASTLTFLATFNEAVTGVGTADFAVAGTTTATVASVTQVTTSTYDVTVSGGDLANFNGVVGLNFNSPNITDLAGNMLLDTEPAIDETYTLDNTAPSTTSFTRKTPSGQNTNADALTFLATFSEAVMGVGTADFSVAGTTTATVASLTQVTTSTYDVTVSGGDLANFNGVVGLNFNSPNITDLAGNMLLDTEPATDETYTLDNTAPSTTSFTRKTPSGQNTNADALTFLATFSEAVMGVETADFAVAGTTTAMVTSVTQVTTSTYDVTVSGGDLANFNGVVGLNFNSPNITDLAGNMLLDTEPAIDETYTIENTAPTVSTLSPANNATGQATNTNLVITFNEHVQKGTGNITIHRKSDDSVVETIDVTNTIVSVSGATVTINPANNLVVDTEYYINIPNTALADVVGNAFTGISDATTWNFKTISRTITLSAVANSPKAENAAGTIDFTFTADVAPTSELTINYTVGGTATNSTDYATLSGTVIMASGTTTAVLKVDPTNDNVVESDETVIITLTNGTNYQVGTELSKTGTIQDDDMAFLSIAAIAQATEDGTNGQFLIATDKQFDQPVTVTVALSGTATNGTDYTSIPTTITFPANANTVTQAVTVTPDNLVEANETVVLTLTGTNNPNVTVGAAPNNTATVTITDDDMATLTIAATAQAAEDATNGLFTISTDKQFQSAVTINVSTTGTATAGSDYTAIPTTITFPANASTVTQAVTVQADNLVEADETVVLTLTGTNNTDITIGAAPNNAATVTITDDDVATLTIAATAQAAEDATNGLFTISTDKQFQSAVTINVSTAGTATAGSDYTTIPTTITFPANANTITQAVTVQADNLVEADETVVLTMTGTNNPDVTVGAAPNNTATVTITDDDIATLTIAATTQAAEDATNGLFTISTDKQFQSAVTINVSTTGTATAGTDYTAIPTTITFPANASTITQAVTVTADNLVEADETVVLTITGTNNTDITVGAAPNNTATVTITDDDKAVLSIAATAQAAEDATNGLFTISTDKQFQSAVTINVSTTGTATAGTDYTAIPATITFPANASTITQAVTVTADNLVEADETVVLTMTGTNNTDVTVGAAPNNTATVIITDDDVATLTIAATAQAAEDATNGLFTISTDKQFQSAVTINVSTTGTATAGTDYTAIPTTITFPANANTITQAVTVTADNLVEADETVVLTMTGTNNPDVTVGAAPNNTATVTITDDDIATLTIAATTQAAEDATNGLFTISTDKQFQSAVTVNVSTTGTATAGTDYTAIPTTITFPANASTVTQAVTVTADNLVEADETVVLTMTGTNNTDVTVGATPNNTATVTITDDDMATLTIAATTQAAEDATNGLFTISTDKQFQSAVTINVNTTGTATAGTDYTAIPTTITFPANANTITQAVTVTVDNLVEADETVVLTMTGTNNTDVTVGATPNNAATVTISDNDACPSLGTLTDPADICQGSTFNLSINGLDNMASANNGNQNFGIKFVAFTTATTNPYSGGITLGTVSFSSLTGTDPNQTATLNNIGNTLAADDYVIYAILAVPHADATCRPSKSINLTVKANPIPTGLTATSANICLGSAATVNLAGGTMLPEGNYIYTYNVDGGTAATATVAMTGGAGSFTISGLIAGNKTINITSVKSNTSDCSTAITGLTTTLAVKAPTTAAAGADQQICGTSLTLQANQPAAGTGVWSFVNNPNNSGVLSNPTSPNAIVSYPRPQVDDIFGENVRAPETFTLRWTTTNTPCPSASDEVEITFTPNVEIDAGADNLAICGVTKDVKAFIPAGTTGAWTVTSATPNMPSLSTTTSSNTVLTGVFGGDYTLRWTAVGGVCNNSFDEVRLKFIPDIDFMNPDGSLGDGVQDCLDLCIGGDDRENTDGVGIPDDCDCDINDIDNEFVAMNVAEYTTYINDQILLNADTAKRIADFQITSDAVIEPKPTHPVVVFQAGNNVTLTPGFHAKKGSDFIATFEYCRDPLTGQFNTLTDGGNPPSQQRVSNVSTLDGWQDQTILTVHPNPIYRTAAIKIELPTAAATSLILYNHQGQQLRAYLQADLLEKGAHYYQLDASQFVPGFYYLQLRTPNGIMTQKLIVQR